MYETLYSSADTQDEMTLLVEKVQRLVNPNSLQEVAKITAGKVKEAVCLMKPKKGDVSGGFTSYALLNAPDILFDQIADVFVDSWHCNLLPAGLLLLAPAEGQQGPC